MEPEHIECMYFVRYYDIARKKRITTSWRMTEEEAAKHFAGQEYEILWQTKQARRMGGDPLKLSLSRFYRGFDDKKD